MLSKTFKCCMYNKYVNYKGSLFDILIKQTCKKITQNTDLSIIQHVILFK